MRNKLALAFWLTAGAVISALTLLTVRDHTRHELT